MEKIKVIIIDDNKVTSDFLKEFLEKYEEVHVLGNCYSDEEEIQMIEDLKPEIVITDLMRSNTLSGLEIIKKYKKNGNMPKFLVITAGDESIIDKKLIDGYISKPIEDYSLIIKELKNIKERIILEELPVKKEKENPYVISNIIKRLITRLNDIIKRKNIK